MAGEKISKEYDGKQEKIRTLKLPEIEVWENKYPDKEYEIQLDIPEFNSVCPLTGLPDFGVIHLQYSPDKWCAELKSFKLYINEFRNIGIFQEHAANKIIEDFAAAVKPRWIELEAEFNARGGIETIIRCSWPNPTDSSNVEPAENT